VSGQTDLGTDATREGFAGGDAVGRPSHEDGLAGRLGGVDGQSQKRLRDPLATARQQDVDVDAHDVLVVLAPPPCGLERRDDVALRVAGDELTHDEEVRDAAVPGPRRLVRHRRVVGVGLRAQDV
jgi:hypothetical protein